LRIELLVHPEWVDPIPIHLEHAEIQQPPDNHWRAQLEQLAREAVPVNVAQSAHQFELRKRRIGDFYLLERLLDYERVQVHKTTSALFLQIERKRRSLADFAGH
jgi:hypothetical protein